MTVRLGPCSAWVEQADIEKVGKIPSDIAPARIAELADVATELLFHLSGRRYAGECEATVRPARRVQGDRRPPSSWGSLGWYSAWGYCSANLNDPFPWGMCGCDGVRSVTLGAYPVTAITEVLLDGVVLDPSAYRVDGFRDLVREDGNQWPIHQNLSLPAGDPGTWSVEFTYGTVPGPAGIYAAAEYTRQLCLRESRDPASKCLLPGTVQSFTRQGVSAGMLDPNDFLDHGRTGVAVVDAWLKAVNPEGRRTYSRVISPDFRPNVTPIDA